MISGVGTIQVTAYFHLHPDSNIPTPGSVNVFSVRQQHGPIDGFNSGVNATNIKSSLYPKLSLHVPHEAHSNFSIHNGSSALDARRLPVRVGSCRMRCAL